MASKLLPRQTSSTTRLGLVNTAHGMAEILVLRTGDVLTALLQLHLGTSTQLVQTETSIIHLYVMYGVYGNPYSVVQAHLKYHENYYVT